ncbi:MAG: sulfotransferase domain-containing protein, partial [Cyclobacteriaceae bacterium]|nr:sulfotransferase domain-containing protein [Cyclobacteriaceae bacterium]
MILNDLFHRIRTAYLEEVYTKPFVKKNHDRKVNSQNSIVLVCHPRGGSNWLGEILLNIHGAILIDEPLWRGYYRSINYTPIIGEGKIKQISKLEFYFDQPIPYNAKWEEARKIMESILKGVYWNYGLWDRNNIRNLEKAETYIIKFCYGHLLLPWIHNQFDVKSIVLHRHPCAVVASQLNYEVFNKIRQNPSGDLPDFRYNEIYNKYNHIWKKVNSKEEYLAAIWALKTKYICDIEIHDNKSMTIFYEELVSNFNLQIKNINNHLNSKLGDNVRSSRDKPSASTPNRNHLKSGERQLSKWKTNLSEGQIYKILKVVEKFGVELYDTDLMP